MGPTDANAEQSVRLLLARGFAREDRIGSWCAGILPLSSIEVCGVVGM
jgi:hypothetical protein